MDHFLNTQLHPAETCVVCTEPFSATHPPVALPCKHIFGHDCIKQWVKKGRGNTSACPTCRYVLVETPTSREAFDATSIWPRLCSQPPERLHVFMMTLWSCLQGLWKRQADGQFSVADILDHAVIPALMHTARRTPHPPATPRGTPDDPVLDCYNLVAASWDSLGRPDRAVGLAVPLVRLARLMSCASATLPRWLTTSGRVNRVIWRANACLGPTEAGVHWDFVVEAAGLENSRYFPLLHLYTVLMSQSIAHNANAQPGAGAGAGAAWPTRRHEVMNLVVERCCTRIAREWWKGRPSNQFKDLLERAYEELRHCQLVKKRKSLRGHDGEESIVTGIWALAKWT